MKSRDRFFWGCSNSTLENKCKGSKAWQKIEVPESLREEVKNFLQKEDASSSDETSNKKRKTDQFIPRPILRHPFPFSTMAS